jgi:DNA-binding response OmpR family regulator
MKILLVDDDAFLRDMYATKFSEDGHTVDVAQTGEAALKKLQSEQFDVILLDVVMPNMTGSEFLTQVIENKLGGEPKCIVLSNQGEEADIAAAKEAGAIGYIVKAELIPSEVVKKVKELVS